MKQHVIAGATIAAAAAALLISGAFKAPSSHAAEGHCIGANACKGHGACKSASNACAGHNACKGQGFTDTTKDECNKVDGANFEAVK
jgi:uncharacterized membrane protein